MQRFLSPKQIERILIAALVILAIGARLVPGPRIIDDAYITFRYARNIVRGDGFVYNPGEHVLGTTTPLYTLLLALTGWLGGGTNFPAISPLINALADGVSVALLAVIVGRLTGDRLPALIVAVLWAISPRSVEFAIAGMETSVYVMLMLGAFAAWTSLPARATHGGKLDSERDTEPKSGGRYALIAVLTGLAILTRPDALIWAGPLALAMVWERLAPHLRPGYRLADLVRHLPWRELGIALLVIAPWAVYGTLTFGSPLTRSFIAKLAAYPVAPGTALATIAVHYGIPFFEQNLFGALAALAGLPIYTALAVVGALALIRANWRAIPLVIFPWLYALTFGLANPPMFHWYLVPPMPMYITCIVAGVWALAARLPAAAPAARNALLAAAGAAWLAISLAAWTLHPSVPPDRPAPLTAWNLPEIDQAAVGDQLAPLAKGGKVIAAADIGALGWTSDAPILDVVGLISPQATPYYPVDRAMIVPAAGFAVAPQMIFDQKPDFIMLHEAYGQNGLFKDSRFMAQYHLLAVYPIDVGHSQRLLVYARNEQP